MTAHEPIHVTVQPDTAEFESAAEKALMAAQALTIETADDYAFAGEQLRHIKGRMRELDEKRKSIVRPLDQARKQIQDLFRVPLDRLADAEDHLKRGMLAWQREEDRKRREQEDKLRQQAAAEEVRKRKALEARAAKAAEKGLDEKAEELRQQAEEVHVPAPVLQSTQPKTSGVVTRKVWTYRVVDEAAIPREFLAVDTAKLGKFARAMGADAKCPGVEFYQDEQLAASAA